MSSLPQQMEEYGLKETLYSPSDVQHIVAREVAKQQMREIKNGLLETNKKLLEMTAQFTAELHAIRTIIEQQPAKVEACKADLRREIERDFPSRLEALQTEKRIEDKIDVVEQQVAIVDTKVDKQWLKITLVLGTLNTVIIGVGVALNYWLMLRQISP